MGKILTLGGVLRSVCVNVRIPRPFVVVDSGKTTIARLGCLSRREERGTSFVPGGGVS